MKNKLINLVITISLIVSLFVGIRLINKKQNKDEYVYIAMGDFLTSVEGSYSDIYYHNNKKIEKYNKFLSRKSMTSSDLLRFLTIDASIIYEGINKSISEVISKSSMVTISVGYNDVMNNVRYNSINNKYVYDKVLIDRVLSSLQSNIYDIVTQLYEYNDSIEVYVLSSYYPYPGIDNTGIELYDDLNDAIEDACFDSKAVFVDIEGVSNIEYFDDNFIPNVDGMAYIAGVIK